MFFGKMLLAAAIALIPLIFYWLFKDNFLSWWQNGSRRPLMILAVSAYYLFVWLFLFTQFVDYYLDSWFITSEKIIDVEQHGLFARTIAELELYRVQDVTSEVKGFLPTVFHYGTIYVQSAGEQKRFIFENIPHPYEIARQILELAEKNKQKNHE